jgi:hypothetical protein
MDRAFDHRTRPYAPESSSGPGRAQGIVYLACPYTDADPDLRQRRFRAANEAAAHLIREGRVVYSPISMTHPIDVVLAGEGATLGSDFWVAFDEAFMSKCSETVVLMLPGWDSSRGVRREIAYFRAQGKPVRYLNADDLSYQDSYAE